MILCIDFLKYLGAELDLSFIFSSASYGHPVNWNFKSNTGGTPAKATAPGGMFSLPYIPCPIFIISIC